MCLITSNDNYFTYHDSYSQRACIAINAVYKYTNHTRLGSHLSNVMFEPTK